VPVPLLNCCSSGLQAVEKLVLSKLLVEGSNRRIFNIDHHAGMVSSSGSSSNRIMCAEQCSVLESAGMLSNC
jgi:hypothetical protein